MEMKRYQKKVIRDLSRYMELLNWEGNMGKAYTAFWNEKGVPVGFGGVKPYQNILPGVPNLCFKVPTGGGKTFLACNAVRPIFDGLPDTKMKAVVWLVPSDAILTQTLAALRNPDHPYRMQLNADFGARVEVYTKDQLLNGQNFNITSVSEQLSVMVLSYDSFRGRKEQLKAKRENSNLAPMAKALGAPAYPVEDADETALIQIINQLSPLVIVDESHHARSTLSKEMLQNFNPCFVLDLTATPTNESNILCYVDAVALKRENMVKLPVIVYNRNSQQEVMADAIDLRNRLEQYAQTEQEAGGGYIRPIVLFQAQPKGKEDSTTFDKLRDKLVSAGIPKEEIAIKTADINELKNVDLLSPACPIRYIITVNALKEGWDCPFAYILASLANKTGQVEVEQIVGRVLRQPHARKHSIPALNMSYVLTSSSDFKATLDKIVKGLNGAGFSDKDYRVGDAPSAPVPKPDYQQEELSETLGTSLPTQDEPEEFLDFDSDALRKDIQARAEVPATTADAMLQNAEREQAAFESAMATGTDFAFEDIPSEVQETMNSYRMNAEFEEEASKIQIPQFFLRVEASFFTQGDYVLLNKEHLAQDFTLKGQPYQIDFYHADDEMARVDINDAEGSTPKVFKMSETDQRYIKEQFSKKSAEDKIRLCKGIIHKQLSKMDMIDDHELSAYIDRIVDEMDKDTLSALEKAPQGFAFRIRRYIEGLLEEHYEKQFAEWLEIGKIVCRPSYSLPAVIAPMKATTTYGKSLYGGEEEANDFEYDMVLALTGMNIKWWHRNMSRKGFMVNGFINHYPDFIVMTEKGKIVLIETKGDHLDNEQNRKKLTLSRRWQEKAGEPFRYYMVFQEKAPELDGAYTFDRFLEMLGKL
ncbi:MAG: DEAD/DEAH box helicase family protein [Oscillospiraceae bacterium]|nr:DEAD/DEAH box helicase family protein [Oscillospiraceae bacterium]